MSVVLFPAEFPASRRRSKPECDEALHGVKKQNVHRGLWKKTMQEPGTILWAVLCLCGEIM